MDASTNAGWLQNHRASLLCPLTLSRLQHAGSETGPQRAAGSLISWRALVQCASTKSPTAISPQRGDVVCISALPPFALLNARTISKRLRLRFPDLKIVVGLWNFSGGGSAAEERFGKAFVDTVVTTLGDALDQIRKFADSISEPHEPGAPRPFAPKAKGEEGAVVAS